MKGEGGFRKQCHDGVKRIQGLAEVGSEGENQESQKVLGSPPREGCAVVALMKNQGSNRFGWTKIEFSLKHVAF